MKVLKVYDYLILQYHRHKCRVAKSKFHTLAKPNIISTKQTIAIICENKLSVSRFGDGEFRLVLAKNIAFQNANHVLVEKLRTILLNETPNHITCLPYSLISTEHLKKAPAEYWKTYFENNYLYFYKYLRLDKVYYDALLTRLYIDNVSKKEAEDNFTAIKQLWHLQDLCIIEGEKSKLGVGNELLDNAKSIKRIIGKSINAFDDYEEIISFLFNNISKDHLVLIALGPTATALAWDLCKLGFWAIDIGHIDIEYEWMKMNAVEKVAIPNKFVGDIFAFDALENENDRNYKQSIIKSFV